VGNLRGGAAGTNQRTHKWENANMALQGLTRSAKSRRATKADGGMELSNRILQWRCDWLAGLKFGRRANKNWAHIWIRVLYKLGWHGCRL
jgi:hypothetical protein